ncbi:MAG: type III-B CRISPR module RAMP protein Cmr6 [Parahaliea sp.]
MPIAAVPDYLGQDFRDASPGMRFGMYLRLWEKNWSKSKDKPLNSVKNLFDNDIKTLRALINRQQSEFDSLASDDSRLRIEALATAPFTTGLGNEHPLENGFAFLNPYGLPCLPGSGIKGVLRQAARELASGDWGERQGWSQEKTFMLEAGKERIEFSAIDALFGLESPDGGTQHLRGALTFWDVIPQIKGDNLLVEIMTPHQSHYYQQKTDRKAGDSITPHDSGQPNPISFLTVPPGSGFCFYVQCNLTHLQRITPELAAEGKWKNLLSAAFEHAFEWLGFGAKTAVGYGQMIDKVAISQQQEAKCKQNLEAAGIKTGSMHWEKARVSATNPGAGTITIAGPDGRQAEGKLFSHLSDAAKKRLKKKKAVFVDAEIEEKGNLIEITSLTESEQ